MSIGQVIRALRIERGLTQEELALDADVATSNISRIESGQRQPTLALLRRLSVALDTSLSRIHAMAEGMEKPQAFQDRSFLEQADAISPLIHEIASNHDGDSVLLLRYYRELTPENQQLVMEQVKLLRRLQKQREAQQQGEGR